MNMAKKDILKGRSIVGKNIFDTANQSIEEIKRANPLLELFKKYGVEFTSANNGEYKGLCPFHNDTNPSLSVNGIKQVFNCFGCGKSGTVIDAVALFENVTRDEAITLLRKPKPAMIEFPEKEKINPEDLKLDLSDIDTDKSINDDHGKSFDLNKVTEYYHKKLFESKTALEYLSSRGIKSPEIISRYKLGFADGSLLNVIGDNQKKELTAAGIINQYGYETFNNCIVFPIFDDNENTVGLYGRNIDDNAKVKHLYLKGKHRGVFNRKASKVYDEIILTESVIDCLSLVEIGFDSVQACYGVNGFTDEHLETLKADRVKTVVIAFDNDDAGIKTGEELKSKLVNDNFKVKIVIPSTGKDWNESLVVGVSKEDIRALIESAEVFENKQDEDKDFIVKVEGNSYIFTINEIVYKLQDVKGVFVSSLKLNIKAGYQGEWFPDKIDIYSSRSRSAYSLNLSKIFPVESKKIEKDLLKILDYLEEERDRKLLQERKEESHKLTEEEISIGLEFLKSPDLFDIVIRDMESLGYVGEDLNKILLYLAASSRILDDPISVLILSQSASGKSMLVETVRKLIPSEDVIAITSLSDQALNYISDLKHKYLVFGEAVHNEQVEHQIREMLSSKELSRLVTVKDEKTGKMSSQIMKKDVLVAAVMSSTNRRLNPENLSRFFVINTDESKEQTRKIHETQRKKYTLERLSEKKEVLPMIVKKHQSAQRLLNKTDIVNNFGKFLDFPDNTMRTRRDNDRFIDLIAVVCFLRQYQKEAKDDGQFKYIECDLTDYRIAYDIMIDGVLPATMHDMQKSAIELYESLRIMARKLSKGNNLKINEVSFTQREIREMTGFGQSWIRENLRLLVEYEYISILRGSNRGERGIYRLKADEEIGKLNFGMIPSPDEMKLKLQNLQSEQSKQK